MKMTCEERKEKGITVEKVRELGLIYRLIDAHRSITRIIGYANTREELEMYVMKEIAEKGNNCDLITQKWIDKGFRCGFGYGRNYYITKPRDFMINGVLVKGVQKSY